jgi:hypothetical protein
MAYRLTQVLVPAVGAEQMSASQAQQHAALEADLASALQWMVKYESKSSRNLKYGIMIMIFR